MCTGTDWEEGFPGRGDSLNKGRDVTRHGAFPLRNWLAPIERCLEIGDAARPGG